MLRLAASRARIVVGEGRSMASPMEHQGDGALVLFSGGQDSATCLAWALDRFERVETLAFDYGQRHRAELDARGPFLAMLRERFPRWSARLGEDHQVDLAALGRLSD